MNNILPISTVRQELPALVNQVNDKLEKVVITVKGLPKAALISTDLLEALEETAEILSIPNIKKVLKKSQKQIRNNEYISLAEL